MGLNTKEVFMKAEFKYNLVKTEENTLKDDVQIMALCNLVLCITCFYTI